MSDPILQLDWRQCPAVDEVLLRLKGLLKAIEQDRRTPVVLSGSLTGRPGAQLIFVDDDGQQVDEDQDTSKATRMFATRSKTTNKRAVDYLLKLGIVCERLIKDLDKRVPVAARFFSYYWNNKRIKKEAAMSLSNDLALTIGVHPYALGVIPEVSGTFSLPEGWKIEFQLCDDIFLFADQAQGAKSKRTVSGPVQGQQIPRMIVSLKVDRQPGFSHKPKAVVVLEHRNVHFMLESLTRHNRDEFKRIFYVLTGGFSDRGTREFLRLLTADKWFQDVPCLFVSDRDPHAMEIFSNLKYGSRACAYESHITATKTIEWAGVGIDTYKKLVEAWPTRVMRSYTAKNPRATKKTRETETNRVKAVTARAMIAPLKQSKALQNTSDKARMKHFHNFRVFSDRYDALLYEDLQKMGMNPIGSREHVSVHTAGEKFALAKLCELNPYGIEEWLLEILKASRVVTTPSATVAQPSSVSTSRQIWQGVLPVT